MSFSDFETEHIRLTILQVLEQDVDFSHNEHVLISALSQLGHGVSHDRLRTELSWLSEQGMLTLNQVGGAVQVAKLTMRGEDIALGRARAPGIARPRPE